MTSVERQALVVQVEVSADPLRSVRGSRDAWVYFSRRHVAGLFEEREVDERSRVALRAGVSVPVPRAAEVAALLDDADVVDAGLLQLGPGHESGEPTADEGDVDLVVERLAVEPVPRTGRRGSGRTCRSVRGIGRCRRARSRLSRSAPVLRSTARRESIGIGHASILPNRRVATRTGAVRPGRPGLASAVRQSNTSSWLSQCRRYDICESPSSCPQVVCAGSSSSRDGRRQPMLTVFGPLERSAMGESRAALQPRHRRRCDRV